MKAIVKVAYYDDLGLHKVGDVVEVKALKTFHKAIENEKPAEAKAEIQAIEKTTKATKKGRKPKKEG